MSTVSIHPKGTTFTRMAIALARGEGNAAGFAESRWGVSSAPAVILRSAVSALGTDDANEIAEYRVAAAEFVEALRPTTLLGKISHYRRVPMRVRLPRVTAGSTVAWVGERSMAPVSSLALDTVNFDAFKISGVIVSTKELAEFSTPAAEGVIRSDLLAAVAALTDRSFIDPDFGGETGVSPPSISTGATVITASGSTAAAAKADLKRLFRTLTDAGVNLIAPYLITDRRTAVAMTFFEDDFFEDVNVNGGMLGGVPLITSASVPTVTDGDSPGVWQSKIVLLDAAELLVADPAEATIDRSGQADLHFESAPDSPSTAATVMKNLWTSNLVAWKVTRAINWEMRRPDAVAVLTNVNY